MLIEKETETDKIAKTLDKIIERTTEEEQKEELYRIIEYILSDKLDLGEKEKLLEKIRKGGKIEMTATEVLYKEYLKNFENGREEGRKQGRAEERAEGKEKTLEMIRRFLKLNVDEEIIAKATEMTKEEIEKIKSGMNS